MRLRRRRAPGFRLLVLDGLWIAAIALAVVGCSGDDGGGGGTTAPDTGADAVSDGSGDAATPDATTDGGGGGDDTGISFEWPEPKDPAFAEMVQVDRFGPFAPRFAGAAEPGEAVDFESEPFQIEGWGPAGQEVTFTCFDLVGSEPQRMVLPFKSVEGLDEPQQAGLPVVEAAPGEQGYSDLFAVEELVADDTYTAQALRGMLPIQRAVGAGMAASTAQTGLVACPAVPAESTFNGYLTGLETSASVASAQSWREGEVLDHLCLSDPYGAPGARSISMTDGSIDAMPIYMTTEGARLDGDLLGVGSRASLVIPALPGEEGFSLVVQPHLLDPSLSGLVRGPDALMQATAPDAVVAVSRALFLCPVTEINEPPVPGSEAILRFVHGADVTSIDIAVEGEVVAGGLTADQLVRSDVLVFPGEELLFTFSESGTGEVLLETELTLAAETPYLIGFGGTEGAYDVVVSEEAAATPPPESQAFARLLTLRGGDAAVTLDLLQSLAGATATVTTAESGTALSGFAAMPAGLHTLQATRGAPLARAYGKTISSGDRLTVVLTARPGEALRTVLESREQRAGIRFIHGSPLSGAVAVKRDGTSIFTGIGFRGVEGYTETAPGEAVFTIHPAAGGEAVLDLTATIEPNKRYTLLFVGSPVAPVGTPRGPRMILLNDDLPSTSGGSAFLRVLHAATNLFEREVTVSVDGIGSPPPDGASFSPIPFGEPQTSTIGVGDFNATANASGITDPVARSDSVLLTSFAGSRTTVLLLDNVGGTSAAQFFVVEETPTQNAAIRATMLLPGTAEADWFVDDRNIARLRRGVVYPIGVPDAGVAAVLVETGTHQMTLTSPGGSPGDAGSVLGSISVEAERASRAFDVPTNWVFHNRGSGVQAIPLDQPIASPRTGSVMLRLSNLSRQPGRLRLELGFAGSPVSLFEPVGSGTVADVAVTDASPIAPYAPLENRFLEIGGVIEYRLFDEADALVASGTLTLRADGVQTLVVLGSAGDSADPLTIAVLSDL